MNPAQYPFWRDPRPLMLASGSQTRRDMLAAAGIPVDVQIPGLDERAAEKAASGAISPLGTAGLAAALASAKAATVSRLHPGRLVLAADQTLSLGERVFHKPADAAEAGAHLAALSGRTHTLHAAATLMRDGEILATHVSSADLTMRALSPAFIEAYVAATLPAILTSVGAYQIEGQGAQLFTKVAGDHFTVLGLPLLPVLASLRDLGVLAR